MNLNLPIKQNLYHKLTSIIIDSQKKKKKPSIIIYFILTDSIDKINPD